MKSYLKLLDKYLYIMTERNRIPGVMYKFTWKNQSTFGREIIVFLPVNIDTGDRWQRNLNERLIFSKWYKAHDKNKWINRRIDVDAENFDIELSFEEKSYLAELCDRGAILDDHGWFECGLNIV